MTNTIDDLPIVTQCCVCHQYKDETGNYSHRVPTPDNFHVSHTYCKPECFIEGSGITYEKAMKMWARIEEKK